MSWRLSPRLDARPGRPGARWWVSAGALAATVILAAYIFDPVHGRARRLQLAERARSLVPGDLLDRGAAGPDTPGGWPEEPPPDVDSEG